jgi:hypothetical protein
MKVFATTVVFEKELTQFLGCHRKTGKKYYQKILAFYGKTARGLLTLAEVASYYQIAESDLKSFER